MKRLRLCRGLCHHQQRRTERNDDQTHDNLIDVKPTEPMLNKRQRLLLFIKRCRHRRT
jgi:hypothetical protein